jgi:hypothetical protein
VTDAAVNGALRDGSGRGNEEREVEAVERKVNNETKKERRGKKEKERTSGRRGTQRACGGRWKSKREGRRKGEEGNALVVACFEHLSLVVRLERLAQRH